MAVIGTRKISELGCSAAFSLSARLALAGALIISGGAIGGDTYAHSGAMAVAAPTVNVTGGGLLSDYLKTNKKLRGRVVRGGGTLLSEFIPDYTPDKRNSFHLRNRIIAALSDGVLVVSGNLKSGARHTAKTAFDLGREIFAFPYSIGVEQGQICNNIIKEGGKLVENLVDITTTFGINLTEKEKITLTELESQILKIIKSGYTHVSKIAELTNKKTYELQATLMTMQIKGVIVDLGGNNFGAVK